jgi:hypothetical protein
VIRTRGPISDSNFKEPKHAFLVSGGIRPSFCQHIVPRKQRAQGIPDASRTRSLVRKAKNTRVNHHRYAETVRHSLRNGLAASFVLSPVTGLFCHRRLRNSFRKLDASVGASGPHDFAVRASNVRLTRYHVHRIPHPTIVTIAKRPLSRRDARKGATDLPDGTSGIFFTWGLDHPNQIESFHEIAVLAHTMEHAGEQKTNLLAREPG